MAASERDPSGHRHPGLDVRVERTGPCRASVTFEVSAEEFARSRAQALKTLAKRTRFKGFRPGKAPMALLEREYGEAVNRDVIEHFLNDAFNRALQDNDLSPATRPRVDLEGLQPEAGQGLSHTFEILLRPEFELGQVRGFELQVQPTDVSAEDVGQAIEDVRRQSARAEPAGEEGLAADGMVVAKLTLRVEGVEEPVLERDGVRLGTKMPPAGVNPELFEKEMTGVEPGDTRSFAVEYPENFPEESARGKKGTCELVVSEVFSFRLPTDEELQRMFEVEDAAALEAAVRERMEKGRREAELERQEAELLGKLIDAHPMELPDELVEQQTQARLADLAESHAAQGGSEEERQAHLAEQTERLREASRRSLRAMYLIEEVAKVEELRVTAEDMAAELRSIAERNKVALDEVRKYYQEEGLLQQLGMELLERKVRTFLRESANVRPA